MRFSFFKKKSTWYFEIFIIILVAVGVAASYFVYKEADRSSRESLIYRTNTLSVVFSSDAVANLSGTPDDIGTPAYEALKKKLISIREVDPFIRFVYIMGEREEGKFFYADSEDPDSEDYSPPGQIYYEESLAFDSSFDGVAATEGPVGDRWGNWVTGAAPITDDEGTVVAIIGIDTDAKYFILNNLARAAIPFFLSLLFVSFALRMMQVRNREQKMMELKHQFVAIASHELRSPLKGISWSLSSLLHSSDICTNHIDTLTKIDASVSRLLNVVNDLLKVAALESGKKNFAFTTIKFADLVERVVDENKPLAEQKQITIAYASSIPTNVYVKVDTTMMFEAISNVLSNAIKYSPQKNNVVIKFEDKQQTYSLSIIDHGMGIPEAEQKRVFEGFYRATNAHESLENGTGLGLYFVKKVVEAHQGTIMLSSQEHKGTVMEICLPKAMRI